MGSSRKKKEDDTPKPRACRRRKYLDELIPDVASPHKRREALQRIYEKPRNSEMLILQLFCFLFATFVLSDMALFFKQGFQDSKTHSKERGSATKRKREPKKHMLHKPWLCSVVLVLMLGCKQHLLRMLGCKQCRLLRCPQWGLKLSQLLGERSLMMLRHATCATKSMKRIAMKNYVLSC